MASRQPAATPRRSWREAPTRAALAPVRQSKTPLRVLATVIVAVLMLAFAWMFWISFQPEPVTHFVAVLAGDSNLLSAPPILFEQATVAPLLELDKGSKELTYSQITLPQCVDQDALRSLLQEKKSRPQDRLIVYVSAHGVSDDGKAYVLAPNYDLDQPDQNRYSVDKLIETVDAVDAAGKVVVFDCARLGAHPRLGLAVNEFANLVEDAAENVAGPDSEGSGLAILLAAPSGETSPMGLAEGRSVLGGAVADVLLGEARQPANSGNGGAAIEGIEGDVSIAEFANYVADKCAFAPVAAPQPKLVVWGSDDEVVRQTLFRAPPANIRLDVVKRLAEAAPALKASAAPLPLAKAAGAATAARALATTTGGADAPSAAPPPRSEAAAPSGGGATSAAPPAAESSAAAPPPAGSGPPAAATAGSQPATASGEGAAASGAPPDAEAPAVAEVPAARAPAPAPAAAAPAVARSLIDQAWKLRDQLNGDNKMQPVDYAPHAWRDLNAKLVALHLELQDPAHVKDANEDIEPYLAGLSALALGGPSPNDDVVTNHLIKARRAYQDDGTLSRLDRVDENHRYRQAALGLRRHLVRARQFLDWHVASVGAVTDGERFKDLTDLIHDYLDALSQLDRALADFEAQDAADRGTDDPLLQQVADAYRQVRSQSTSLDEALVDEIQIVTNNANAATRRRIEALLSTDLPNVDERAALLAAAAPEARDDASGQTPASGNQEDSSDRAALAGPDAVAHLKLEIQFAQLLDPQTATYEEFRVALALSDDDVSNPAVRNAAIVLGKFYANIPNNIAKLAPGTIDAKASRLAERLAAGVHPRDSAILTAPSAAFVVPRAGPAVFIQLAVDSDPLRLRAGKSATLTWTVGLPEGVGDEFTATIVTPPTSDLDIQFAAADKRSAPLRTMKFRNTTKIPLLVTPNAPLSGSETSRTHTVELRVEAHINGRPLRKSGEVRIVLPQPNRIELIVDTVAPKLRETEFAGAADQERAQKVVIRPFPNRTTTFTLSLVNHTDEPKPLLVELFKAPELVGPDASFDGGWATGRLLNEKNVVPKELDAWVAANLDNAEPIATWTGTVQNDGEEQLIVFKPPGDPEPAPAEGATAPPAPAAEPPAKPPKPEITHGLICRLINQEHKDEVLLKWLEVAPRRPDSYFELTGDFVPQQTRSDEKEIDYFVQSKAKDREGKPLLPPGYKEEAIPIFIRGEGVVYPPGQLARHVVTPFEVEQAALVPFVTTPNAGLRGDDYTVAMDIDGVPRAAYWSLNFLREEVSPAPHPPNGVRLVSVKLPVNGKVLGRIYHQEPYIDYPPIEEDPKAVQVVPYPADRTLSFNSSPGQLPDFSIRLQVDAPRDAFDYVGDGSKVTLKWSTGATSSHNLYSSREFASQVEFTEAGAMVVETKTDDFTIALPPPAVNDEVVKLTAELFIGGESVHSDELDVVFDQNAPRITNATAPTTPVIIGSPVPMTLEVADLSGIEKVEVWFAPKQPTTAAELAEVEPTAALTNVENKPQHDKVWSRTLPLPGLVAPAKAGPYFIIVRATDRSGQQGTSLLKTPLTVVDPPVEIPKPVLGTLRGVVVFEGSGRPVPGVTVQIDKTSLSGRTNGAGAFEIPNVKGRPEPYKLILQGTFSAAPVIGDAEVTITEQENFAEEVRINANIDRSPPKPPPGG